MLACSFGDDGHEVAAVLELPGWYRAELWMCPCAHSSVRARFLPVRSRVCVPGCAAVPSVWDLRVARWEQGRPVGRCALLPRCITKMLVCITAVLLLLWETVGAVNVAVGYCAGSACRKMSRLRSSCPTVYKGPVKPGELFSLLMVQCYIAEDVTWLRKADRRLCSWWARRRSSSTARRPKRGWARAFASSVLIR